MLHLKNLGKFRQHEKIQGKKIDKILQFERNFIHKIKIQSNLVNSNFSGLEILF